MLDGLDILHLLHHRASCQKDNQRSKPEAGPESGTETENEKEETDDCEAEAGSERASESQAISPRLTLFLEMAIIVLCSVTLAEGCATPWDRVIALIFASHTRATTVF